MIKIVYFVHGTTIDNELKQAAGWNDVLLSEKGIYQSLQLKEKIDMDSIDLVISSDLKRAVDSAHNIFGDKKEILTDERIRECNYGVLNGANKELVKYEEHIYDKFEDGESLIDVEKRVKDFCNYLLENYDGKTIALVSHRAPQLVFERMCNNLTWEEAIKNDWRNTGSWQPGWNYVIK